jgi:hypothetical protein
MSTSTAVETPGLSKIAAALLAVQRKIEGVSKSADNPYFKSKYADLGAVIDATIPLLNEHGIVVIQLPTAGPEGTLALTTMLLHESGESISGTAVMPLSKQDPQAYGSAMTYARRYSLAAAVSLKTLDDDGEGATDHGKGGLQQPKPFVKPEAKTQAAAPQRAKTAMFPVPKAKGGKAKGGGDDGEASDSE